MRRFLSFMMFASLLMFAACEKNPGTTDEDGNGGDPTATTPVFPEKTSKVITLDESATFSVTPNADWTVSIPDSKEASTYFKVVINKEELIGYSRKGEAGTKLEFTVSGRAEDFENPHTLVITLTMGGESREIAEIELMKAGSKFAAYPAKLDENDAFVYEEYTEGDLTKYRLVYSDEPLNDGDEIELLDNYNNYLRVTANRAWKVTAPKWLVLDKTGGEKGSITEIHISSNDAIRPFEDVKDEKITFFVDDDTQLAEYNVSMSGCASEFSYTIQNAPNITLSASEGTVTGTVTAAYGSKVFLAYPDGEEWIKFEAGKNIADNSWTDEEKEAGLHSKDFSAKYEANESYEEKRTAHLFCIPLGVELDETKALTETGAVAEDFKNYHLATYTQQRADKPRSETALNVVSMVGQDDSSTAGAELYALLQEYAEGFYPEGWWGDALDNMQTVFKLQLREPIYCELTPLKIENGYDYEIVYHPDDVEAQTNWIKDIVEDGATGYRTISFDLTGLGDEETGWTDVKWTREPKVPEAYIIFKDEKGLETGALIVEVYEDAFKIPLQNVTISKDIGFTILSEGQTGYDAKYADVPQYKVNGYDRTTGQADPKGRVMSPVLLLTFYSGSDAAALGFDIDYDFLQTKEAYEHIEGGLANGSLEDFGIGYLIEGAEHYGSAPYIMLYLGGGGPDQFRIICKNKSGNIVCTVYIYYEEETLE